MHPKLLPTALFNNSHLPPTLTAPTHPPPSPHLFPSRTSSSLLSSHLPLCPMASRPLRTVPLTTASSISNIPTRKRRRSERLRATKRPRTVTTPPPKESLEDLVVKNVLSSPTSVNPGFLSNSENHSVNDHVREVVVDWLMEVAEEYDARPQTLALAVNYMDRTLESMPVEKSSLQLLAIVCMLIACKIEETDPPSVADIIFICDNSYEKYEVYEMETRVLVHLDFRLTYPTHFNVVSYIANTMRCSSKRVTAIAEFAAHVALMDAQLAAQRAGVVALGCVLVAMKIENLDGSCLDECPGSELEKCGKEAGLAALRVFEVWCQLRRKHRASQSRWIFLRWPDIAERFAAVADGGADDKLRKKKRVVKKLKRDDKCEG